MSILNSPRTPWLMLVLFCVVALLLFLAAAGRDLGLIGGMPHDSQTTAAKREVRMPIVIDQPAHDHSGTADPRQPIPAAPPKRTEENPQTAAEQIAADPEPSREPSTPSGIKGTLHSHHFIAEAGRFEATFKTDRPIKDPRVFFKSAPAIWVVDLPGNWINRARRVNTFNLGPIDRVVIGEHERYLRVVFRYREREKAKPADPPLVINSEDGFAVIIGQ